MDIEADVCVIGSGVAGAIVSRELLDAGREVLMIDAGEASNPDALGLRLLERGMQHYRIPRMKMWFRSRTYAGADYTASGYTLRGRALFARGGSTLGWSGDAYRMMPEDFRLASSSGVGADWAVGYEDLEPYYEKAEATLGVSGDASDEGHPPRRGPFFRTPIPYHDRDQPFVGLLSERGWPPMHHNVALDDVGRVFTADSLVRDLEERKGFRLSLNTVASRIVFSSRHRAAAVECKSTKGTARFRVCASQFVVCAGGIETPNLLLRSANRWWPRGIGNHSGHVGLHLVSHGGVAIGGRPKGIRIRNGPIAPTAASRCFDTEAQQKAGKALLIWRPAPSGLLFFNAVFEQFPSEGNSVRPGVGVTRFGTPRPVVVLDRENDQHRARLSSLESLFEEFASAVGLKIAHRRTYLLAHPMCTARMSRDPADGVVDESLRVHSTDNVYLCGSSVFASGGAANPTLTIATLAHRLGVHLSEQA